MVAVSLQESRDATEKRLAGQAMSDAESSLLAEVVKVNSHDGMANNPNIKFRTFVCCGLNNRVLHEWVRILTVDKDTMVKFYESWALVNSNAEALPQLMTSLQPLADQTYELSIDFELGKLHPARLDARTRYARLNPTQPRPVLTSPSCSLALTVDSSLGPALKAARRK